MYQIAILDDDIQDGEQLKRLLQSIVERRGLCCKIECFYRSEELFAAIEQQPVPYDLLLLDILMEGQNGVELAHRLRQRRNKSKIIFVTVSPDFAIEGYKVQADNYLLKPIKSSELEAALNRIFVSEENFVIHENGGMRLLPVDSIQYIEIIGHYLHISMDSGSISLRGTLSELMEKLSSERFIRCHRSFLVNISWVREAGASRLLLKNSTELPVSRRYTAAVRKALVEYVERNIPFY